MKLRISRNKSVVSLAVATSSLLLFSCNNNAHFNKSVPGANNNAQADSQLAAKKAKDAAQEAIEGATQAGIASDWSCDSEQSLKLYNSKCPENQVISISQDLTSMNIISEEDATDPDDTDPTPGVASLHNVFKCSLKRQGALSLTSANSSTDFMGQLSLSAAVLSGPSANLTGCQSTLENTPNAAKANNSVQIEIAYEQGDMNTLVVTYGKNKNSLVYDRVSPPPAVVFPQPSGMPSLPPEQLPNVVLAPQSPSPAQQQSK